MKVYVILVFLMCVAGLVKSAPSSYFVLICTKNGGTIGDTGNPMKIITYGTSRTRDIPVSYIVTSSSSGTYQLRYGPLTAAVSKVQDLELRQLAMDAFKNGLDVYVCVEETSPDTVWLIEAIKPQ